MKKYLKLGLLLCLIFIASNIISLSTATKADDNLKELTDEEWEQYKEGVFNSYSDELRDDNPHKTDWESANNEMNVYKESVDWYKLTYDDLEKLYTYYDTYNSIYAYPVVSKLIKDEEAKTITIKDKFEMFENNILNENGSRTSYFRKLYNEHDSFILPSSVEHEGVTYKVIYDCPHPFLQHNNRIKNIWLEDGITISTRCENFLSNMNELTYLKVGSGINILPRYFAMSNKNLQYIDFSTATDLKVLGYECISADSNRNAKLKYIDFSKCPIEYVDYYCIAGYTNCIGIRFNENYSINFASNTEYYNNLTTAIEDYNWDISNHTNVYIASSCDNLIEFTGNFEFFDAYSFSSYYLSKLNKYNLLSKAKYIEGSNSSMVYGTDFLYLPNAVNISTNLNSQNIIHDMYIGENITSITDYGIGQWAASAHNTKNMNLYVNIFKEEWDNVYNSPNGFDVNSYYKNVYFADHIYYELMGGEFESGYEAPDRYMSAWVTNENAIAHNIDGNTYIKSPQREGYEFLGWTIKNMSDGSEYVTVPGENGKTVIPTSSSGDIKFYANWKEITYTVTYYSVNKTDIIKSETVKQGHDSTAPLLKNLEDEIYENTVIEYTFDKWIDINGNDAILNDISSDISVYPLYTSSQHIMTLDSINVRKEADKTEYYEGEVFNPAGMIVDAVYKYKTHEVTVKDIKPDIDMQTPLKITDRYWNISYTDGDTKNCQVSITVNKANVDTTSDTGDDVIITKDTSNIVHYVFAIIVSATLWFYYIKNKDLKQV